MTATTYCAIPDEAGAELDRLIAVELLHLDESQLQIARNVSFYQRGQLHPVFPSYSTEIERAYDVLVKLQQLGFLVSLQFFAGSIRCLVFNRNAGAGRAAVDRYDDFAAAQALVICQAALQAIRAYPDGAF